MIGHEPQGNATEYEQKRCINFAKRGIIALSLGWVGFGELALKGDDHDDAGALDLVGSNALGFFYWACGEASIPGLIAAGRYYSPGSDGFVRRRMANYVLSALDSRVAVSVEVAGFGSFAVQYHIIPGDTDEIEENATDFAAGQDYPSLAAMRAPRPTLLIHNAEDNCCFRAALVKPYIYDKIVPFFNLYGKPDAGLVREHRSWHA